jgi:hypothetical protein
MKTPENTEENHDDPEPEDEVTKITCKNLDQYMH